MNSTIAMGATAVMSVALIELAKRLSFMPFIHQGTKTLNTWLSRLLAICATAGINFAWFPQDGRLEITGLSLESIATVVIQLSVQFWVQEGVYTRLIRERRT